MSRSPPVKNRRMTFVNLALYYAEDDSHGYSQKPPSGRWGPDYDCSSLLYFLAEKAGYPVGSGGDKVRYTGTMLKDFEKAGFQILPFANVGISDLKIGDILLNLALHAEVYVGNGESVGATGSETGGFVGEAGDQTGSEIERHPVTTFDKGWDYVLRPPSDDDEETEEGDDDVPMYNQPMTGTTGWPQSTVPMGNMYPNGWPQGQNNGYPQGVGRPMYNNGYPQGNLGQMNGYSQANAGYPQGSPTEDLPFVMGIEGAKNVQGTPNGRRAVFDEDKPLMYIISFDQRGVVNEIHTFPLGNECSEEMPQHLSPLMKQNMMPVENGLGNTADYITREEFEQLKEMLSNAKPSAQAAANESRPPVPTQSANAGRTR